MGKIIASLFVVTALIVVNYSSVQASFLVINTEGGVRTNVLSAEDDITLASPSHDDLTIGKVANSNDSDASIVRLNQKAGKFNLEVYGTTSGIKSLDVSNINETIVEVEERKDTEKIEIGVSKGQFSLKNKGAVALTTLPITIDSKSADLTIKTDTGEKILAVFPFDAVQSALRTNLLSSVDNSHIEILVVDDKLQYKIDGAKIINFFDVYNYSIPVSSYISALTGEIIRIDAPGWLKVVNVLFS